MTTTQRVTPLHPTLTRRRGEETYEQIRSLLDSGPVELILPSDVPLSLSYLDGVVVKLLNAERLQDVTFVTGDRRVHDKLARIVDIRSIEIYARFGENADRERVAPKAGPFESPPVEISKAEAEAEAEAESSRLETA